MSDLFTYDSPAEYLRRQLRAAGWTEQCGHSGRPTGFWRKGDKLFSEVDALRQLDALPPENDTQEGE